LRADHLKRYRDLLALLWKHGRGDLMKIPGLEGEVPESLPNQAPKAEELAADLERMGPTFTKLGQLLSTRGDLLPVTYLQALERLQDRVEPFPFEQVEEIVTKELGVRPSKAFATFDAMPMASASLAQVHRATLRDGREVAVKVQRPGIREQVLEDLEVFAAIADLAEKHSETARRYQLRVLVDEFRRSLLRELDYHREAGHLATMRRNLAAYPRIVVPVAIEGYSTSRVLTMERVVGIKIDKLSPVLRTELPGAELADELLEAYLHQILVDGFFHADPHPGNVLLTQDHRIALLDLGMVGLLSPTLQEQLLKLLAAVTDGRGDEAADLVMRVSSLRDGFDATSFKRQVTHVVAEHRETRAADLQVGRVVLELVGYASAAGVQVPPELALLGKTLLNLDTVVRSLDPDLDVSAALQRHLAEIVRDRLMHSTRPGRIFATLSESKELVEQMPARINRILDHLAENRLKLHVDAIDENELLQGLQKIANRIAMGVILASLIIGAALMMRVQTSFTLLGYPGLAMIFFLLAAAGGVGMVWSIVTRDRHSTRRDRH
jgi:predicted unusual protein kinase regulating ubiquinone biosynthesis (AarF/ABC1/UbiB family)